MKLFKKLDGAGVAHILVPLVVIVGVGIVGSYLLIASHADSLTGDIPVPGDYNGDKKADLAVWRPSSGTWYVKGVETVQYGQKGDIPLPGDYNHDGKADLAVYRPSTCTFYIRGQAAIAWKSNYTPGNCKTGTPTSAVDLFGSNTTAPTITISDVETGQASSLLWSTPPYDQTANWLGVFGIPGDIPVPGKYTSTTQGVLAVWRPSNGTWYISRALNAVTPAVASTTQYGQTGDIPVPADYSGDGKTDIAVWRPSNGTWYVRGIETVQYGQPR